MIEFTGNIESSNEDLSVGSKFYLDVSMVQDRFRPKNVEGNTLSFDEAFLVDTYGESLWEGVQFLQDSIAKSVGEYRTNQDGHLVYCEDLLNFKTSKLHISETEDSLIVWHTIKNSETGEWILPDHKAHRSSEEKFQLKYEALSKSSNPPFYIVSSFKLDEVGMPKLEHNIVFTIDGFKEVLINFTNYFDHTLLYVPENETFSYMVEKVSEQLKNKLAQIIRESEKDISNTYDEENLIQSLRRKKRDDTSISISNEDQYFSLLSKFYSYFTVEDFRLDSESLTASLEVRSPALIDVLDSKNLIFRTATSGNINCKYDINLGQTIDGLPLEHSFLQTVKWFNQKFKISLKDGLVVIN